KHNELIAKHAESMQHHDVLMLAQFSMASAKSAVSKVAKVPVLAPPEAAVKKLRGILLQEV
ncbi:MAG: arylsulfatase, partial [Pseudomonadota bacterium]|nr:arylsulfatase [Pseudomonadota bacterium]